MLAAEDLLEIGAKISYKKYQKIFSGRSRAAVYIWDSGPDPTQSAPGTIAVPNRTTRSSKGLRENEQLGERGRIE